MSFKIQINSLEALVRLLGDPSPEMMAEIRGSIIQEFAKKHIKSFAQYEIEKIKSDTISAMRKEAEDIFGTYKASSRYTGYTEFVLKEDIKAKIKEAVGVVLKEELNRLVQSYLDGDTIKKLVDKSITLETKTTVDREVRRIVQEKFAQLKKIVD